MILVRLLPSAVDGVFLLSGTSLQPRHGPCLVLLTLGQHGLHGLRDLHGLHGLHDLHGLYGTALTAVAVVVLSVRIESLGNPLPARPSTPRIGRLRLDEPDHLTRGPASPIRPLLGRVCRLSAVGLSSPGGSHTHSPGSPGMSPSSIPAMAATRRMAYSRSWARLRWPGCRRESTSTSRTLEELPACGESTKAAAGAVIPAIDRRWLVPGNCHAGAGTLLLLRSARWGSQLGGDGQGGVHVAVVVARDLVLAGLGGCGPGGGAVAWHG